MIGVRISMSNIHKSLDLHPRLGNERSGNEDECPKGLVMETGSVRILVVSKRWLSCCSEGGLCQLAEMMSIPDRAA